MVERIEWKGKVLATVLRRGYDEEGVNFITSQDNPLQLGVLKHQKGTRIKAHSHKNNPRVIRQIQEVLFVEYGKVEVEFFDDKEKRVAGRILNSGDSILLRSGGHGFNVLEDSKIIEIKQGPYYGAEKDKERFGRKKESRNNDTRL